MKTAQELKEELLETQYEWLKEDLENSEIFNTTGCICYELGLIPEVVKRIVQEYNYDATNYKCANIKDSYTYISCIHTEEKKGGLYCYIKDTVDNGMITQHIELIQYPYNEFFEETSDIKPSQYQA